MAFEYLNHRNIQGIIKHFIEHLFIFSDSLKENILAGYMKTFLYISHLTFFFFFLDTT